MGSNIEKRISDYQETEEKLKTEISQLKIDYENKFRQYNKTYDQEKDNFKAKIADLEQRLYDAETCKTKEKFNHEAEITMLNRGIREKDDKIDEQKSKIMLLTKENDKLKANQRQSRKAPYGAERSSSNFGKNLSKVGIGIANKFIKGQGSTNSSISGSQKENTDIHHTSNSKYISDHFGKTMHFDQLTTNKSGTPLQKTDNPMNSSTYMPFDSREDEVEE